MFFNLSVNISCWNATPSGRQLTVNGLECLKKLVRIVGRRSVTSVVGRKETMLGMLIVGDCIRAITPSTYLETRREFQRGRSGTMSLLRARHYLRSRVSSDASPSDKWPRVVTMKCKHGRPRSRGARHVLIAPTGHAPVSHLKPIVVFVSIQCNQ